MRSKTRLLALLVATPALLLGSGTASCGEIPPILYANLEFIDGAYPIWVSAEAAFTADGELDPRLFHPLNHHNLGDLLSLAPNPKRGCVEIGEKFVDWVNPPNRGDLSKAVEHSDRILLASVVETSPGFDRGLPGHLIRVEPEEVFKGRMPLPWYYFFVPVGEFVAGPYTICKDDYRYPRLPQVGNEVVLLVPRSEDPAEPYLDLMWSTSLIVLDTDQKVFTSKELRFPENSSRGELLSSLRRLLAVPQNTAPDEGAGQ